MHEWINNLDSNKRKIVEKEIQTAESFEDIVSVYEEHHPQGYLNSEPIKHLDEYLRYIRCVPGNPPWFRGESKEHEFLVPKLYRNTERSIEELLYLETNYLDEFKRRGQSLINGSEHFDTWNWYFLIQHYGGPTRLLDWTSDASVALFMALDNSIEQHCNPVVFTLAPKILANHALESTGVEKSQNAPIPHSGPHLVSRWIGNLERSKKPVPEIPLPLLPPYSDTRIISQKSCFTLFGRTRHGFLSNGKRLECSCCGRKIVKTLIIDRNAKNTILEELRLIGISYDSIFPGLEGLNKQITKDFFG